MIQTNKSWIYSILKRTRRSRLSVQKGEEAEKSVASVETFLQKHDKMIAFGTIIASIWCGGSGHKR